MGQNYTTRIWTAGFSLLFHLPGQAILGTYFWTVYCWFEDDMVKCPTAAAPTSPHPRDGTRIKFQLHRMSGSIREGCLAETISLTSGHQAEESALALTCLVLSIVPHAGRTGFALCHGHLCWKPQAGLDLSRENRGVLPPHWTSSQAELQSCWH